MFFTFYFLGTIKGNNKCLFIMLYKKKDYILPNKLEMYSMMRFKDKPDVLYPRAVQN